VVDALERRTELHQIPRIVFQSVGGESPLICELHRLDQFSLRLAMVNGLNSFTSASFITRLSSVAPHDAVR